MDVSHTHIWVFMDLPPRGVVPHTVSHVAARSVVLPLLPAARFTSAASHRSQPHFRLSFCSCSLAWKSHPACHFAQSIHPSVHQNLLPRLCRSALRILQLRLRPCFPTTCHQATTLWRLPITGTESGAPSLGAFALSFKSQVLNHVSRCSWTRWTTMFSCVCWTTGCTNDGS